MLEEEKKDVANIKFIIEFRNNIFLLIFNIYFELCYFYRHTFSLLFIYIPIL